MVGAVEGSIGRAFSRGTTVLWSALSSVDIDVLGGVFGGVLSGDLSLVDLVCTDDRLDRIVETVLLRRLSLRMGEPKKDVLNPGERGDAGGDSTKPPWWPPG